MKWSEFVTGKASVVTVYLGNSWIDPHTSLIHIYHGHPSFCEHLNLAPQVAASHNFDLHNWGLPPSSFRNFCSWWTITKISIFPTMAMSDSWRVLSIGTLRYCLIVAPSLMNRKEAEDRICPVALNIFDKWTETHPQFPHAIQCSNNTLVINIMLSPPRWCSRNHYPTYL